MGFDVPDETVYASLSLPERRSLLRAGIGAVFVRRSTVRGGRYAPDPAERVLILWPGDEPDDLPGRRNGGDVPLIPLDW